ncbi:hypothetical protein [Rubrivirga sp.]|uniref:hypothetical protein n=1 Tax=Rubrivirga sp. TaxID=1885344 RepID=UPI003C745684
MSRWTNRAGVLEVERCVEVRRAIEVGPGDPPGRPYSTTEVVIEGAPSSRSSTVGCAGLTASRALAVLLLCVGSAHAQSAQLTVLQDSVSAGDPFEVAVTVRHAPGQQTAFPDVPVSTGNRPSLAFGDALVLEVERFPPRRTASARVDSAVFRVVTFAADTARVGPVEVVVSDRGETIPLATRAAVVPVRSVLEGEAPWEPAPFSDPEPFPSAAPVWIALGVLAASLVGLAVWGLTRVLRRPRGTITSVDPYQGALARLGALDADAPDTPEAVEAFVVEVRAIVRDYLEKRVRVPAATSTTDDLGAVLEADARVTSESAGMVRHVLRPTDLVAFARVRPAAHVAAGIRDQARSVLQAVEADVTRSERPVEPANAVSPSA